MSAKDAIGALESLAKIFALIVGGVWALYNFNVLERPFLADKLSTVLDVDINQASLETCKVDVGVRISNGAKSSVILSGIELKVWAFEYPNDSPGEIVFADTLVENLGTPVWELPAGADTMFAKKIDPGESFEYTYELFVPSSLASMLLVRLEPISESKEISEENFSQLVAAMCPSLLEVAGE
jgi:hypothetical protein